MKRHEALRIGAALAIGAVVAFPLGMMLGRGRPQAEPPRSIASATMRQVYSPRVLSDPYFLEQERKNVAILERQCRERGTYCAEAAAAQRALDRR